MTSSLHISTSWNSNEDDFGEFNDWNTTIWTGGNLNNLGNAHSHEHSSQTGENLDLFENACLDPFNRQIGHEAWITPAAIGYLPIFAAQPTDDHLDDFSNLEPFSEGITQSDDTTLPTPSTVRRRKRRKKAKPDLERPRTLRPLRPCISPQQRQQAHSVSSGTAFEYIVANDLANATNFDAALTRGLCTGGLTAGFNAGPARLAIDGHIAALTQLLTRNSLARHLEHNGALKRNLTAAGVLWVIRTGWPGFEAYWNLCGALQGFLAVQLFRCWPCEKTYRNLPPMFRPTKKQLLVPHIVNIDWCCWPEFRDLLIDVQTDIDHGQELAFLTSNVVVCPRRKFGVDGAGEYNNAIMPANSPADTAFRLLDLVSLDRANGIDLSADWRLEQKAQLRSPSVQSLVRAYGLRHDQVDLRIDDAFFERYPYLYAGSAACPYKVTDIPGLRQDDLGQPVALTQEAVMVLKRTLEEIVREDALRRRDEAKN
ncbi:uncharacterized protein AB675_11310 [Cyphellophora attinorum]|uniref:Uncharacterized protein n=1 Tax=Cyphellophora attinorum TaxID=1664694 RepID=A0A0N1NYH4_9EURO|nr:uncharacterized protein AB675_11310 [Phialophora attinorum]KPI40140.1 hypothetical protein AB675_11310 [Phialophora attinorum]